MRRDISFTTCSNERVAIEYAAQGIRVNAVNPGDVETPMVAHLFAQIAADNPGAAAMREIRSACSYQGTERLSPQARVPPSA